MKERLVKTPLIQIDDGNHVNLYAKLEGNNITGSMKDRPANLLLERMNIDGSISEYNGVIESSSGNMAIALASACKVNHTKFICVTDPNILPVNLRLLEKLDAYIVMVNEKDDTGGYLKTRLKIVKKMADENNLYWVNQYNNPEVVQAYRGLAEEIEQQTDNVDAIFIPVSSCGCIAGVSQYFAKSNRNPLIVAVDIEGSQIFRTKEVERHIPGVGSSIHPPNVENSFIDDIIVTKEKNVLSACEELKEKLFFVGGSSGMVYEGYKQYLRKNKQKLLGKKVVMIFADRGERYIDTLYNNDWFKLINERK